MQILDDLIFPDDLIAYACQGKRRRKTDVVTNQAGYAKSNVVWQRTLRSYEVGLVARPIPHWEAIAALHEVVDGRAYGFLLRDPTDSRIGPAEGFMRPVAADGAALGASDFGFGVPTYRLAKRYRFLSRAKDIDITKPQSQGIVLQRGGVPITLGAGAGNAAVNASTGWVTFVADATRAVLDVTVGASTVVELNAVIGLVAGDRLWLQDLTGADAQLLNGLSHQISAVDGAEYTLSTNTVGAAITPAGTARKFPQASEALTWLGRFFIPVSFTSDDLDWQMVAGSGNEDARLVAGPSIQLEEVRLP